MVMNYDDGKYIAHWDRDKIMQKADELMKLIHSQDKELYAPEVDILKALHIYLSDYGDKWYD